MALVALSVPFQSSTSLGIHTSSVLSHTWLVTAFKASCEINLGELRDILLQSGVIAVSGCSVFELSLGDFLVGCFSHIIGNVVIGVLFLVAL